MIRRIKADQRYFSDFGWLKTYWLFSFDNYYDPSNMEFGNLRVFNDDVVAPGSGFPSHSHREMEIVTVVLSGEVTHKDTTGAQTAIRSGEVQRMSAGTGISHSEYNLGSVPVHLYQIWIRPTVRGLAPSYEQRSFEGTDFKNVLVPVASGQGFPGVVSMHADSSIYLSELENGASIEFNTNHSRAIFVYVGNGQLTLNGHIIETNDQARIELEEALAIEAAEASRFILIDVPHRR
ncbi:MAG TPA: pirin family protein [Blastocatellia bacterium]|nr:pirin family protein [Blastocatellia bacterium]